MKVWKKIKLSIDSNGELVVQNYNKIFSNLDNFKNETLNESNTIQNLAYMKEKNKLIEKSLKEIENYKDFLKNKSLHVLTDNKKY